ncbi:glycosyl hydrolase protein [Venturia nashicola]|uniref:Glycosyl hydrolase protein n=1 Tax=Venturia nashicola TaxID=86259 RepID=A0A4Z1P2L3_9PEZI|nr:glycosyl hydrolase protein [Venturia nashicola]
MYLSLTASALTFFLALTPLLTLVRGDDSYLNNAVTAVKVLQNWYNQSTGLYQSTGWWNSANCITTLADLTVIDSQVDIITGQIWPNTFEKAQKFNLKQSRAPGSCATTVCTDAKQRVLAVNATKRHLDSSIGRREVQTVDGLEIEDADPKGFLNGFYDDEGWWALAWIQVYDLTKKPQYLQAADDIFKDMVSTGYNATCGGIWWDKKKQANTAIANELFLSVAAHLANRMPNKVYYTNWAVRQWDWFQRTGLINSDNTINDGLNLTTCKNSGDLVWSYNQGVILGALIELTKATNNKQLLLDAQDIANGAIRTMVDSDGILHDPREPNLGGDGYQFKGIFNRNLAKLQKVTGSDLYKEFLERNAQSVWNKARNKQDNVFTGVWSGPFDAAHANAATQCSGLDALVGAAAVQ